MKLKFIQNKNNAPALKHLWGQLQSHDYLVTITVNGIQIVKVARYFRYI